MLAYAAAVPQAPGAHGQESLHGGRCFAGSNGESAAPYSGIEVGHHRGHGPGLAPIAEETRTPLRGVVADTGCTAHGGLDASSLLVDEFELCNRSSDSTLQGASPIGSPQHQQDQQHHPWDLSREVQLLAERLWHLERQVVGRMGNLHYLEGHIAKIVDGCRQDAEQRQEMAAHFAASLLEERQSRLQEVQEIRALVVGAGLAEARQDEWASRLASAGAAEMAWIKQAAAAEISALAASVKVLGRRISEDLSEQHAQAALDLADRHLEAATALDARSGEIATLVAGLRRDVVELRGQLCEEVFDIARAGLEEQVWNCVSKHSQKTDDREPSRRDAEFSGGHVGDDVAVAAARRAGSDADSQGKAARVLRNNGRLGIHPTSASLVPTSSASCAAPKVWGLQFLKDNGCLQQPSSRIG
mmetsp:Transcript_69268/g.224710  ORF Transcript_69268/g.224710 Transcript_69268/m.224710 type:complete len:416 (-) Transcript_69268:177-1424(-)